MELIIHLLMALILVNSIIKLSFWKIGQIALMMLVYTVYILLIYPVAIKQSKTQIEDFLADHVMMQNMSVVVTVESAVCFAFCFAALMGHFGSKKHKIVRLILKYYPGILPFLVLFYGLTQAAFTFTGFHFLTMAILYASIVILCMVLAVIALKKLIPEFDLRLEIHFMMSLIICILGLITTVDGKIIYKSSEETINVNYILLSMGLFIFFFLIGFLGNKIKWRLTKWKNC